MDTSANDDTMRFRDSAAGWVAIALAVVTVATFVILLTFFIVAGHFGLINDAGNGLIGVLSAVLALLLVRRAGGPVGVVAAVIGAAVAGCGDRGS
jgi:divalent metal cation (Fe/Co/Zn/Cd) transporter